MGTLSWRNQCNLINGWLTCCGLTACNLRDHTFITWLKRGFYAAQCILCVIEADRAFKAQQKITSPSLPPLP